MSVERAPVTLSFNALISIKPDDEVELKLRERLLRKLKETVSEEATRKISYNDENDERCNYPFPKLKRAVVVCTKSGSQKRYPKPPEATSSRYRLYSLVLIVLFCKFSASFLQLDMRDTKINSHRHPLNVDDDKVLAKTLIIVYILVDWYLHNLPGKAMIIYNLVMKADVVNLRWIYWIYVIEKTMRLFCETKNYNPLFLQLV